VARTQSIQIREVLNTLVPPSRLGRLARETGAVVRRRRIAMVPFFWTLILGFGADRTRTLAGLRRAFESATGRTVVPSAFYDRFNAGLVRLLRAILSEVITKVGRTEKHLDGPLSGFKDVLASDSTVIRLHEMLKKAFPACRTNHTLAALKTHVILSVRGAGAKSVKITSERVHDGPVLRAGRWVKDTLLLFDLGYHRFQLFACIDREGGYFVTRLKKSDNPLVTGLNRNPRGRKVPLLGQRLKPLLKKLKRRVIDVEVELSYRKRKYGGSRSGAKYRCRLVGIFNEETKRHHTYLTNIPASRLSAHQIAATYKARWLVELLFRELKTRYRLDQMPSAKRHIVEALILAAFITILVAQHLLQDVQRRLRKLSHRLRTERWAAVFATYAGEILRLLLAPADNPRPARLGTVMLRESVDPNVRRQLLLQRVSEVTYAA
jgi:IS4 transposase